ncbi:hypothetical protein E1293_24010 [Actinomadura darangshiensis]|uniref:Uncharacterized protein n=1 Tax=Actinomadura darangshiensis TaxID=705336 RepID=A0A4R5B3C7_9ACTN|nr:hypothetical protein [Actinomadura darangshiensis]TDD79219.1 hypothetical protein E1293_24010 [Actinomadura darangshiensis]
MTPWAAADLDPERVAAGLARRFPGCCVWRGEYTGSWWALARDRLVEAPDPAALGRLLDELTRRDHAGRYSRAALQNRAAGRATPTPPRASRPAVHSRPPARRPPAGVRRLERRPRGGWLRRLLGSFVVVEEL